MKEHNSKKIKYTTPKIEIISIKTLNLLQAFSSYAKFMDYDDAGEWGVDEFGNPLEEIWFED